MMGWVEDKGNIFRMLVILYQCFGTDKKKKTIEKPGSMTVNF